MAKYQLKFHSTREEQGKIFHFEAEDAAMALMIAHQEADDASAELWNENGPLCTIRRTGRQRQIWCIGPAPRQARWREAWPEKVAAPLPATAA